MLFQDVLRRRRSRKGDTGFSLTFAAFAGLIGVLVGLLLSLIFSSPPATAWWDAEVAAKNVQIDATMNSGKETRLSILVPTAILFFFWVVVLCETITGCMRCYHLSPVFASSSPFVFAPYFFVILFVFSSVYVYVVVVRIQRLEM